MRTSELLEQHKNGKRFKGPSEISLNNHHISKPQDLFANSPIIQDMINKYSLVLSQNKKGNPTNMDFLS